MKKFLQVLLCACLTVGVAVGCGKPADTALEEEKTAEEETVKVYPEHIDAFVDTTGYGEPPEIIYTTSASENGLEGALYKIEGKVTESTATEGDEGKSVGSFTVKTDIGEISIVDPSTMLMILSAEYGGFTDEDLQKYFAVPKEGEKVCVYVEYLGYSDVLQAPACYYGGKDYIEKVSMSMLMDNGYADETEEAKEEQTAQPQQDTATEQRRIESSVRTICAENYKSTTVSNITVNENLGTDAEGDYILLVDFTWDVKNSKDTTKKMLAMYSKDFAEKVGTNLQNVSEVTMFWKVPHYSKTDNVVKYTYTRENSGMYQTDAVISALLN